MQRLHTLDSQSAQPAMALCAIRSASALTLMPLLACVLLASAAFGQDVHWNSPGVLAAGERTNLELEFDETAPAEAVRLPRIDGLQVVGPPSQATNISVVNGRRTSTFTLSYPVRPEHEGAVDIPAFEVRTSAGTQTVARTSMTVAAAARAASAKTARGRDLVQAQLLVSKRKPYAGEVFDVDFVVASRAPGTAQLSGTPEWDKGSVFAEPWSDGKQVQASGNPAVRFHTRAVVPEPGTAELPGVRQDVQIGSRPGLIDDPFANGFFSDSLSDAFFGGSQTTSVTAQSAPVPLEVQPLPRPAPAGFSGAVGQFRLESKMVPTNAKAGEPVTWTLTLRGTGNWPGRVELPARAVPADVRTLQPKLHKDFSANDLFTGNVSEDLVMIPGQAGTYAFEPVHFVYFDPQTGRYETASVEPPTLEVTGAFPASGTAADTAPVPVRAGAANDAAGQEVPRQAAARTPEGLQALVDRAPLPRDPQTGSAVGWTPWPAKRLAGLLALPFLMLAAYWLNLSSRRARLTDPRRGQRAAFVQLEAAIQAAGGATDATERVRALLDWQHAAAVVLDLERAAPSVDQVRAHAPEGWADLWSESERTLYAKDSELPASWCDQARSVCARTPRPRFNPLRMFMTRNLVPAAAAAAMILWAGQSRGSDAALAEYTNGHFSAAREQLQADAASRPNDWIARYNLGLAEAQSGSAARALAHTGAAFLLQPRSEATRWNLRTFAAQVPGADPHFATLVSARGLAALARCAGPAEWQAILLTAAVLICAGGAVGLRNAYAGGADARRRWLARLPTMGGLALAGSALLALQQYGVLANPAAAVVAQETVLRSVPTDAQEAQAQHQILPGSVVLLQKDFLGWIRVALPSGETGWLRRDAIVPFYAAPKA
jgi:hypothetical protein